VREEFDAGVDAEEVDGERMEVGFGWGKGGGGAEGVEDAVAVVYAGVEGGDIEAAVPGVGEGEGGLPGLGGDVGAAQEAVRLAAAGEGLRSRRTTSLFWLSMRCCRNTYIVGIKIH
jgi:hypothetical protein